MNTHVYNRSVGFADERFGLRLASVTNLLLASFFSLLLLLRFGDDFVVFRMCHDSMEGGEPPNHSQKRVVCLLLVVEPI